MITRTRGQINPVFGMLANADILIPKLAFCFIDNSAIAMDLSPYRHRGNFVGSTIRDINPGGTKAVYFPTITSSILVFDSLHLRLNNPLFELTVAIRIRATVTSQFAGIIGKLSSGSWADGWGMYINNATQVAMFSNKWNQFARATVNVNSVLNTNTYVMVCKNDICNAYANGVKGNIVDVGSPAVVDTSNVRIGLLPGGGSFSCLGYCEWVQIYQKAFTDEQALRFSRNIGVWDWLKHSYSRGITAPIRPIPPFSIIYPEGMTGIGDGSYGPLDDNLIGVSQDQY